jgi:hypothetical protein
MRKLLIGAAAISLFGLAPLAAIADDDDRGRWRGGHESWTHDRGHGHGAKHHHHHRRYGPPHVKYYAPRVVVRPPIVYAPPPPPVVAYPAPYPGVNHVDVGFRVFF